MVRFLGYDGLACKEVFLACWSVLLHSLMEGGGRYGPCFQVLGVYRSCLLPFPQTFSFFFFFFGAFGLGGAKKFLGLERFWEDVCVKIINSTQMFKLVGESKFNIISNTPLTCGLELSRKTQQVEINNKCRGNNVARV